MSKRVAVVGSSGGNLFSLGGNEPEALISEVNRQADAAGIELARVQFVAAKHSMDSANADTPAALCSLRDGDPTRIQEGTLEEVNDVAREMDGELAREIKPER